MVADPISPPHFPSHFSHISPMHFSHDPISPISLPPFLTPKIWYTIAMKNATPLLFIIATLLVVLVVAGYYFFQKEKVQPSSLIVSTPSDLYDKNQWELIRYQKVDSLRRQGTTPTDVVVFSEKTNNIDLYLLRSHVQTSATGAEAPLYDLNFIVARGDKILY